MGSISEMTETSPTQPDDVQTLIQQLHNLSPALGKGNNEARTTALRLAKELTASLTAPLDRAMDIVFTPFIASAVQIAVKMHLFEALVKQQDIPISTNELALRCCAEPLLVGRILRLLASMGFVDEAGTGSWLPNETTEAMAIPAIAAGHRFVWDIQVEGTIQAPQYLEETGFTCPIDPNNGFIQYAQRTKYDVFEYMAKVRRDRLLDFHCFMGNTMGSSAYWVDWYPIKERILSGYDASTPLLVDVGGGKGHDILSFARKFPDTTGQLILQDIEPALATIAEKDRDLRVTYQPQDFFRPNAVNGARVYFMHHILHDWSEKHALRILSKIRAAMKPGYSKLLIHDLILPDQGASQYQAGYDMVMMTFNSGVERSESQWRELLTMAGLHVERFWHGSQGRDADGIVEAALLDS